LTQKSQDDRRLIMLLEPLYEQEREQAVREGEAIGLQKGEVIGLQKGEVIGLQKGEVIGLQKGEVIGLQKGEVIGLQKGEVIGLQKGEAKLVIRQIRRRFGEIPQNITDKISKLSPEYLESLGEALLDFQSLTDVSDWLGRK
jgi:hypothetical protein